MKTISFFLMIALSLTFIACTKLNDSKPSVNINMSTVNELTKMDSGTVFRVKSELLAQFRNDSTTFHKDSFIYEIRILITGFENPVIDTIKTDLIRSVLADSIIYSFGGSKSYFNMAELKSFELSSDKKEITLGYSIPRAEKAYFFEYIVHNDETGILGELKASGFSKSIPSSTVEMTDIKVSTN